MWGPLLCLASGLCYWGLSKMASSMLALGFPSLTPSDLGYAANWALSLLQALVATSYGVYSLVSTRGLVMAPLPTLQPYAWAALGYWLYDIIALYHLANTPPETETRPQDLTTGTDSRGGSVAKQEAPSGSLLLQVAVFVRWWPAIVAHHAGVIFFFGLGVLGPTRNGVGDGMIGMGQCIEVSSIALAARGLLDRLQLKATKLYTLVSVLMVVTFFFGRMVFVPWVISLYSRQHGLGPLAGFFSIPIKCQVCTSLAYGLNTYWFLLMLRGALRLIKRRKGGSTRIQSPVSESHVSHKVLGSKKE